MRRFKTSPTLFAIACLASSASVYAQTPGTLPPATQPEEATPAWMTNLATRHQQLIEANGPGTDPALRDRLLKDVDIDQDARLTLLQEAKRSGGDPDLSKLRPNDLKLTSELKDIVASNGWPTIHLVGADASHAAMTILTHTEDHAWQETLLPTLEQLSAEGKIDGSELALVIDKQLVAAGKLQRYGTQFKFTDGRMAMYAVENPATLDDRRAAALLPPLVVYQQMLSSAYNMPVAKEVVPAATPPAPQPQQ